MSEVDTALADPYRVQRGDTLTKIAKRSGHSLQDLLRWNGIRNPNQLHEGQVLYLSEASAFGVSVLFLDALRHPIENLAYRLRYDGKTVSGSTGSNGTAPRKITKSAQSEFEVWVRNAQAQWQQLTNTVSGHGHKLITLVSPSVVVKGQTERLPTGVPAMPVAPPKPAEPASAQKPAPPPVTGSPTKNNPQVKTQKAKGPQGQPVLKISVEIPQGLLDLFANYKGGDIGEADWKDTADGLGCEKEVLKAIAKVESGGRSAYWRLNSGEGAFIPAILFERHYFSRLTKKKYDATHPDISWPSGYLSRKNAHVGDANAKQPQGQVHESDLYSDYASSYLRLINAYRLDQDAALKSCSWGKFQVMGENWAVCGADDAISFVKSMCTSDLEQIKLLAKFIENKPRAWKDVKHKELGKEISLLEAVRTKNWQAIAFNYNGPSYATYNYHHQIEAAYKHYKNGGA